MDKFSDNELCDGKYCKDKMKCARWMVRIDIDKCTMPYINFVRRPFKGKCKYFIERPNENYPEANETDFQRRLSTLKRKATDTA